MKKTLIITLALVFVLSVAGTAFAANPFVDVPANHWAYGAVAKLAKAGVVDGMGDGTYQGARNMTRYEMAQIVAKAMAKADKADAANKALIEKLEAEFAAELNNLGVRVKNLEAKVGSIAFSGDARIRYMKNEGSDSTTAQRLRLNMKAQVNEDVSFYGRFMAMNHNEFGTTAADDNDADGLDATADNDITKIVDANFTFKNFLNSDITAVVGRFSQKFLTVGHICDSVGMVDGAKVAFGDKVKMTLGYADFDAASDLQEAFFATADYALSSATTVNAMYLKEKDIAAQYDIYGLGFKAKLNKDWYLAADYSKNTELTGDPVLYVGRLGYKGANKAVTGSWGAYVEYLKAEAGALPSGVSGASVPTTNVKGWNVKFETALAKNVVLEAWQTFNQKKASDSSEANDRTRVQINLYF